MFLLHRAQIHRLFDNLIVICHFVPVDRLCEWPRGAVILHVIEQMQELIVIRSVARLSS